MYDVVIIGGGPGGSIAGISLARAGLQVLVVEKDVFPRDKLCGEFLSGEGRRLLAGLGLEGKLREADATPVTKFLITSPGGGRLEAAAPADSIALSRYRLDDLLLREANDSGAELMTGDAARDVTGNLTEGFEVAVGRNVIRARAVICAAGRSDRILDTLRNGRRSPSPDSHVAFKAYYAESTHNHAVELHAFSGGYCGLQSVEDGRVNACWISRASSLRQAGGKPADMIRTTFSENGHLRRRIESLGEPSETFFAVSNLDFRPRTPVESDVLMVGDSAGMIAPLCGDGMAMAMRSGLNAASLVEALLGGRIDPVQAKARYSTEWRRSFRSRMWLGSILHAGMERRWLCDFGVRCVAMLPPAVEWLTHRTRGA